MSVVATHDLLDQLDPREREALSVLSVFPSYTPSIALHVLSECGIDEPDRCLASLEYLPVWVRKSTLWQSIREPFKSAALEQLNGSKVMVKKRAYEALVATKDVGAELLTAESIELDLQVARLGSGITEFAPHSVDALRSYYNAGVQLQHRRLEHLVHRYVAENYTYSTTALHEKSTFEDYELNALFILGMHEYKYGSFEKALDFLTPVWQKRVSDTIRAYLDASTAAHLVGVIKSKDSSVINEAIVALRDATTLGGLGMSDYAVAVSEHSLAKVLGNKKVRLYPEAENLLKNSLSYMRREDTPLSVSFVLHSLGRLYAEQRLRWEEAYAVFDEAIIYAEQVHGASCDEQIGKILHSRGLLYIRDGKPELALPELFKSLELRGDNPLDKAQVNRSIGIAYEAMEKFPIALQYYGRSFQEGLAARNKYHLRKVAESILKMLRSHGPSEELKIWESKLREYVR